MLTIEISSLARDAARKIYAYYRDEVGEVRLAERFQAEFMAACRFLAANPGVGSPRFAHLLQGVDLRTWSLNHYPFHIFYVRQGRKLRILDVGHERRNVTRSTLARLKVKHSG